MHKQGANFTIWWIFAAFLSVLLIACDSGATGDAIIGAEQNVTPSPGKGAVVGTLLEWDRKVPSPDGVLYLGEIVRGSDGVSDMASLDASRAPRAYTDKQGRFYFNDVLPQEYVLATATPKGYVFLVDPNSNKEIRFVVKTGETFSLGKVYVDNSAFR